MIEKKASGRKMIFLLTGDARIGKTRWLMRLVDELFQANVESHGVLAPGRWEPSKEGRPDHAYLDKVGIDNILLPVGHRIAFADRVDLAPCDGSGCRAEQSMRMGLGWRIFDEAIETVNAHLAKLPSLWVEEGARCVLVIDELGPLELRGKGGLSEAMALLERGPQGRATDAIVIVRESLVVEAEERYAPHWGGSCRIAPGESSRAIVRSILDIE